MHLYVLAEPAVQVGVFDLDPREAGIGKHQQAQNGFPLHNCALAVQLSSYFEITLAPPSITTA